MNETVNSMGDSATVAGSNMGMDLTESPDCFFRICCFPTAVVVHKGHQECCAACCDCDLWLWICCFYVYCCCWTPIVPRPPHKHPEPECIMKLCCPGMAVAGQKRWSSCGEMCGDIDFWGVLCCAYWYTVFCWQPIPSSAATYQ